MEGGRSDPAWAYCRQIEGNRYGTICNFCGLVIKSGGITRFKYHLAGNDPNKNTRPCHHVPPELKQELTATIKTNQDMKLKKKARMEDVQSELRYGRPDEDSDDSELEIRAAMHASRESFRQEEERSRSGIERGQRSQSGSIPRSFSTKEPSYYRSAGSRQRKIKDMFKGSAVKETMGRLISKFFIYDNIPANKAKSHHFKNMIVGAQQAGTGIPTPSAYEIRSKYLDIEYEEMQQYVDELRSKWSTYGCTIMCDGWTGPTKLSIINFMVYCKGNTIFLKSVDASEKIKDYKYIYNLLKDVINEVGRSNVVQIVTDNGSAYKKAGEHIMKRYNIYWTPCAAHCIDLMFEDVGKRPNIDNFLRAARGITNFIYNHGWLLAKMREYCDGDLIRPGATRFATNFIALTSLISKKAGIKRLFTSDEWAENKLSRSQIGRDIEVRVLNHSFWEGVETMVSIYEPMYNVLRIVDTEVVPTMPIVYDVIQTMKLKINQLKGKGWVIDIIQSRWDKTSSHPLHAAAYYLNPRFQYYNGIGENIDLMKAVHDVYTHLFPNCPGASEFGNELTYFRDARKGFAERTAIASRKKMVPCEWWNMYGSSSPTVRKLAIRVLAQTASSSACERNWSTFALIHTKQRNRLAHEKLQKLVFCYYNMKLKLRDMEAENDRVAETDYLDLVDAGVQEDGEADNPLYDWIRPAHLDDVDGNPDPTVSQKASEAGINVDSVMREKVGISSDSEYSFNTDDREFLRGYGYQFSLHPSVRSEKSDGTGTGTGTETGTGTGGGDDDNDDGGNDGDGGGGMEYAGEYMGQSSQTGGMSPFTGEADFTHATQDEDHGSRRGGVGVGAIGKPSHRRRSIGSYNSR